MGFLRQLHITNMFPCIQEGLELQVALGAHRQLRAFRGQTNRVGLVIPTLRGALGSLAATTC